MTSQNIAKRFQTMYVKIKTNGNIAQSLAYHEQKLDRKQAQCILAENFLMDVEDLSRKDKLWQMQRLTSQNERARLNTIHISVNFQTSETITNELMGQVAKEYMAGIGLGDQPYLVYRHYDAKHPHCHVLSPKIAEKGERVELNEVIRKESLKISKELEVKYNLVRLQKRSMRQRQEEESTVQKIEEAVLKVVPNYRYTNLEELNAALAAYHVQAYRGKEESRLYQRRGLVYRIVDKDGHRISAPIKASALEGKPTLRQLEERFEENLVLREEHRLSMTTAIDWTLYKSHLSYEAFGEKIEKEGVSLVEKRDEARQVERLWFVDWVNKAVWDAEVLGQEYTAREIQKRCVSEEEYRQRQIEEEHHLTQRQRLGGL